MRICVIGAGAIGGLLAAKLAHAGEDVSVIARGAHLAGIVENGLSLLEEGQEIVARVAASDRIAGVGEQDFFLFSRSSGECELTRDQRAIKNSNFCRISPSRGETFAPYDGGTPPAPRRRPLRQAALAAAHIVERQ